ncbi:MAG: DUF935 family protein [Pseudomonadota bacterium]|nr:DUF935 family protein [Pseudomonadota bacterium]
MSDWTSLGLDEILREVRAATIVEPKRGLVPSGIDREPDITQEIIPIPKELAPEAVFRYRSEARRGDPRNLYAVYHEMPGRAAGPQIRRSRETIESAECIFAPMPVTARDETIRTPEATMGREVAAYLEEQLRPFVPTALGVYARREQFGLGAAAFKVEAGTGPEGMERALSLEEIMPRRFRLNTQTYGYEFFPKARGGERVPVAPFVQTGSLLLFEDGAGSSALDQKGLLWQIVIPWCVYQFGFRWWARLNESCAIPYRKATYAKNIVNGAEEAEKLVKKLGAAGYVVKPEGIELDFMNAMSGAQTDSLERAQDFCIRSFASALLGHEQASGARQGAGAQTSDVFAARVNEELVSQQLRRASVDLMAQWVRPMVVRNFGEKVAIKHTSHLHLRSTEKVDREAEARIANLAVNAGARIPQSEFLKKIGYREARPGEEVLSRAARLPAEPKPEKLADVVRFPMLAASGAAPVLGYDGAPDGIAEDLLGPYRAVFVTAIKEGATPIQALSRVQQRARTRPDGKVLADRLASVLFASTGHGLEQARDERSGG